MDFIVSRLLAAFLEEQYFEVSHFQIVSVSDLVDDVANCTWIESFCDEVFAVSVSHLNRAGL